MLAGFVEGYMLVLFGTSESLDDAVRDDAVRY